jgi:hypothetical protein
MPALVPIRLLVTAHAYAILMAQGAQLATFEVDKIVVVPYVSDPTMRRYSVRRLLTDVSELIIIDDAVASAADAAAMSAGVLQCDIGTLRKKRVRVMTLKACSCQFKDVLGFAMSPHPCSSMVSEITR